MALRPTPDSFSAFHIINHPEAPSPPVPEDQIGRADLRITQRHKDDGRLHADQAARNWYCEFRIEISGASPEEVRSRLHLAIAALEL